MWRIGCQGGSGGICWEDTAVVQVRHDMDWVWGFTITDSRTCLDSKSILKVDPMG